MNITDINPNFEDWSVDCQDFLTEAEVDLIRNCTIEVLTSIFSREKDPIRRTVLLQVVKDRMVLEVAKVHSIGFVKAKKHHYYEELRRVKKEQKKEPLPPGGIKITREEALEIALSVTKDREKIKKLENELENWKEKEWEIKLQDEEDSSMDIKKETGE